MSFRPGLLRALAVAVAAVVALVAAPAPAATPAAMKYGTKLFSTINVQRVNHDRAKLHRNKCLQRFANKQAQRMADQQRMFHQDLDKIQRVCNVGWVGENVAYGPFSANALVQLWMHSAPHKANVLFPKFRITGVAARWAGGVWWASQVFGRKM